jgi:hypothetical protein
LRKNTAVGVSSVPSMLQSLELGRSRSEGSGFRYVGTAAADYDYVVMQINVRMVARSIVFIGWFWWVTSLWPDVRIEWHQIG